MPRAKKDSRPFNIKLSLPLWEKVEKYNQETGIPKTVIVEKALEEYFGECNSFCGHFLSARQKKKNNL